MVSDEEISRLLEEQRLMREFVQHPGARILAKKLKVTARQAMKRQLDADPYTEADIICRNKQLRYVLTVLIPDIIEKHVNYHPGTVDKQVAPKKRWSVLDWFK